MNNERLVVLVDDDRLNNMVCRKLIQLVGEQPSQIVEFTDPELGLDFVHETTKVRSGDRALLLLDLNMPVMSGWDFLTEFAKFDQERKAAFTIYIVSSSLDPKDRQRAEQNPYVRDMIVKPLTRDILRGILK